MSCPRPLPCAMPKSDTWPGGVAMESLSNLDSAGSCDSVISMNSAYSEDSMEHLSAEERACLMYLEETIEALEVQEVQEDSGLSNDEPDPLSQADKMRVNDISNFNSESGLDQKPESGSRVLTVEDGAGLYALNHTSEPQDSPAKDFESQMNLVTPPTPPVPDVVSDSKIHPTATELCVSTDADGHLKIVPSASLDPSQASDVEAVMIPPPLDFMDKPRLPPQPLTARDLLPSAGTSNHNPAPVDLEELRRRASAKRGPVISSETQEPPNKPPELRLAPVSSGPPLSPPSPAEAAEPRTPPAVAPKPKKLPANIILKSHKAAGPGSDANSGHLVSPNSDRVLLDPQRVRMEALRKLGLLPADADLGPALSPKLSPKSRRSWAAPASPISPAAPNTPPSTPSTPSHSRVHSLPPASVPVQSPAVVTPPDTSTVQLAEILPAPAAFSDPDPESSASEASVNTPPLTPPLLLKHPTPPKAVGVKSATLERSGLRSSQQSSSQLRNTRARPASLGSGKEFSSAQGADATSKEPDVRRSLPAVQHAADSQKLPRSQGISVLICPRAENGENRREALKKLGLLRD